MPNETSTKSTTDCEVGAEHNCKAGVQCDYAVAPLSERATRLQDRHPKLTRHEAAMICEVADNIVRYARRQEAEMAAAVVVQKAQPVVLHEIPTLPPATPHPGRITVQIVSYMTHDHQGWVTMLGVAKALGLKYDRVRYGFRLLMDELVRGPDIRRPQGGTPIRQYRLAQAGMVP